MASYGCLCLHAFHGKSEGCQLPLQCIADANRISRLDEEQNEYEYVDEVLTITHALATRKTVSSSGLFFVDAGFLWIFMRFGVFLR